MPNLNTEEDAKWLTEVLTEAGYLTCEDGTGRQCQFTAIGPPTDAGSALASTASSTTSTSGTQTRKKSSKSSAKLADELHDLLGPMVRDAQAFITIPGFSSSLLEAYRNVDDALSKIRNSGLSESDAKSLLATLEALENKIKGDKMLTGELNDAQAELKVFIKSFN